MRVLYISHDSNMQGGANYALLELIIEQRKNNNIEPIVLVPNEKGKLIDELEKEEIQYVVWKHEWWVFVKSKYLIKNIYLYLLLIKNQIIMNIKIGSLLDIIRELKIDIIHTNSSVINIGAIISKKCNIPHVWHVREFGEEHLNFRFLFGARLSRKLMANYSEKVIVISNALKDKYKRFIGNDNKIKCIYDGLGLNYDNICDDNSKKLQGRFRILIVGSIHRGKGQIEIVKAATELINEGYDISLELAGPIFDNQYFNEINQSIANNDLQDKIKYIGEIKNLRVVRTKANLEVICSEMEAFGRVTVEAMLSMLPVIASDSGANNELINDKYNGLIYKKGDIEDLKNKIVILYKDRNIAIKMGLNGYKIAKENYMITNNVKNIFKIYKEVIES